LWASSARAACPSGANYNSLANFVGALTTLSSGYGVTTCYYVAAGGSDMNNGTSEATPFQHAPLMANCANSCAAVTLAGGSAIIFKGGDTFHFGNNTGSYSGGRWNIGNAGINGTSSNLIYVGVDPTWFTGGSWTRPIFNGDNPLCNAGTLGGGCSQDNTNY